MSSEVVDIHSKLEAIQWFLGGRWKHFDIIHHISGTNWWWGISLAMARKRIVWHWVGSDVLSFSQMRDAHYSWRAILTCHAAYRWAYAHLADSPKLAEELHNLGIKAGTVRLLPISIEAEIEPLPQKFSVLGYWLDGRRDFYGGGITLQLAREFSDIEFKIAGTTGEGQPTPPNVKFLGFRDNMSEIYSQASALIRIPVHDSLSVMVLEMLARGRYVIYNKELPGCHFATNLAQARAALLEIKQKSEPNKLGAEEVKNNFSLDKQSRA